MADHLAFDQGPDDLEGFRERPTTNTSPTRAMRPWTACRQAGSKESTRNISAFAQEVASQPESMEAIYHEALAAPSTHSHHKRAQHARRIFKIWPTLNLAGQFVLATSIFLIISMMVLGAWVVDEIEDSVIQNMATATAFYIDRSISPIAQELSQSHNLSDKSRKAFDELVSKNAFGKRMLAFTIWGKNGFVIYSSHGEIAGKTFETNDHLKSAWDGIVTAEFNASHSREVKFERGSRKPLLEVYLPILEKNSRQVIAVGQFYEDATDLKDDLLAAKLHSWLLVAMLTLATITVQWSIVRRGSQTIERQRSDLKQRVTELLLLLKQNEELRHRAQRANEQAAEINEQFLRQIGADLHDGPAQLLGLALLRVGSVKSQIQQTTISMQDIDAVKGALSDALKEIRDLSAGLALPEIEQLTLEETLRVAVRAHESRTETSVQTEISQLPEDVRLPIKVCLYRFVQEALNNAFKHANGCGQRLRTTCDETSLEVVIEDTGGGLASTPDDAFASGLGLSGLRERIETLGGEIKIQTHPLQGTTLSAIFATKNWELQ